MPTFRQPLPLIFLGFRETGGKWSQEPKCLSIYSNPASPKTGPHPDPPLCGFSRSTGIWSENQPFYIQQAFCMESPFLEPQALSWAGILWEAFWSTDWEVNTELHSSWTIWLWQYPRPERSKEMGWLQRGSFRTASANGPSAKSDPTFVSVNKVLLGHSRAHLLCIVCGWFHATKSQLINCNSTAHKA